MTGLRGPDDLRNVAVVKYNLASPVARRARADGAGDGRTRARVKAYLLAHGGATAGELGDALG